MNSVSLEKNILQIGRQAKEASRYVSQLSTKSKNEILCSAADNLLKNKESILKANELDIKENKDKLNSATLDRLVLDEKRIESISSGLVEISGLEDPVGKIIDKWSRPNGLEIEKTSIPLGVIGVIYESRPNVSADAAGLCLKSGNALILRGGSESFNSSSKIVEIINRSYENFKLHKGILQYIPTKDRNAVGHLLKMDDFVDVIIPRGGRSLIERVINDSKVHVIRHLDGICHTYIDKFANKKMAVNITYNAKMRRTSICGATETILCHKDIAKQVLPPLLKKLLDAGCEVRGDSNVVLFSKKIKKANEQDWKKEYLDSIVSIKVVNNLNEAIKHINNYSSKHTDAIITNSTKNAKLFLTEIESAIVMHNTSTQFSDGAEFGLGAEIGISTGKLHARGPVSTQELTTYKYIVKGNGQLRQ